MQTLGLSPFGGEFRDHGREEAFLLERLPETLRHSRLLFLLSAVLNALFFVSDWRFYGEGQFFVAIPARAVVVAVAAVCFVLIRRATTIGRARRLLAAWQWINAVAVAFLVSSHSDLAFLVVFMLPLIYYLVVPTSFWLSVLAGGGCSALMLAGYLLPGPASSTAVGLVLAMVMLNTALALVVTRSNRLRRLEWAATQAERQTKEELAASREMLETMFMAAPIPLIVTSRDDGRFVKANRAAYAYFGGDPTVLGIETMEQVYVDPCQRALLLKTLERHGRVDGFEARVRLAGGDVRDVLVAVSPIEVDGVRQLMSGVVDITSRKALEAHLERLATTDPLTGLANRHRFFALAAQELQRCRRHDRPLAVMMADLDHFKRINDTYGHEAGDRALKAFADICPELLRAHDLAARFGGEEFAVLLPETGREGAAAVAERLRARVQTLIVAGGAVAESGVRLSVSIGIALVHPGESTVDAALSRADRAMYAAKRDGRNCVRQEAVEYERNATVGV